MILITSSGWIALVLVIVFLVVMLGAFQRMRRESSRGVGIRLAL